MNGLVPDASCLAVVYGRDHTIRYGGRHVGPLMQYPAFDLNYLWGYQMASPLQPVAQPQEADET